MSGSPPLIGLDCRFASTHSGIGRYTRELVVHLLQRKDPWKYVLIGWPVGAQHAAPLQNTHTSYTVVEAPYSHYSINEQLRLPLTIQRANLSLLHFPHFNTPLFCPTPFVATIHDLILHRFPNEASFGKRLAYRFLMGSTLRRARHIIAVSEATKSDLTEVYGKEVKAKISVIHEGLSGSFQRVPEGEQQRTMKKYQLKIPYILYVGAAKEHKNVQMLIDACPEELTLVLVTSGKEISRLRLRPHVRILQNVPDADLPGLYGSATAYVSPALAEGFNFPVLEAMACGCPVIATNRGATPEILGRFGTLVEPTVEGLTKGISDVTNQKIETNNQKLALAHAQSFTWEKAAEETATVYAACINKT